MGSRIISELKWARKLDSRPVCIPIGRPRGAKLAGVRYENELASHLATFLHGVWWEFEDANGRGFCQTDLIRHTPRDTVLLECKYTWTSTAERQLLDLYVPVVSLALRIPQSQIVPIVVCKKLVPQTMLRIIHSSLESALEEETRHPRLWHHLGGVPQLRSFQASPARDSLTFLPARAS